MVHPDLGSRGDGVRCTDVRCTGLRQTSSVTLTCSHLYLEPIQQCYLFAGCKRKFLDILMSSCR